MQKIEFKIDEESPASVYCQLKDQLIAEMRSGVLRDSLKLPPVRELSALAHVSLGTMHRVISKLVEEGFCIQKPRIGVYINRKALSGTRRKILILKHIHPITDHYFDQCFQFAREDLYRDFLIQTRSCFYEQYGNGLRILPPGEFDEIRREQPDCLLVALPHISRKEALELAELPFPVIFLGDFHFGELRDPRISQIREDTGQRAENFVRIAFAMGFRDLVFVGGNEVAYYTTFLRNAGEQTARELGCRFRFLHFDRSRVPAGESLSKFYDTLLQNLASDILAGGMPEAIFFDGSERAEKAVALFEHAGYHLGKDYSIFSGALESCTTVLIRRNTDEFAGTAAKFIRNATVSGKASFGLQTIRNAITSKVISCTEFKPFLSGEKNDEKIHTY